MALSCDSRVATNKMFGEKNMTTSNTESTIRTNVQGKIMDIEIHRPEKKNALTRDMYLALVNSLEKADKDESIHVIVLRGSGDCFSAGNDLNDFLNPDPSNQLQPGRRFLEAISTVAKPIVAAVNGPAVGVGTTMLLHCDLVYAGMQATFQVPFVNLGLCPEGGSSLLLPRAIGFHRASEMLLLGEPISANMAWEFGLINNVYPNEQLHEKVFEQARKLAAKPLASVMLVKRLLRESRLKTVPETIEDELRYFLERLSSKEFTDAYATFFKTR
jgi:enoyl-CoA hydratase/carnithine racemase